MRLNSEEEEEDKQYQITSPDSAQINTESSSQEIPSYLQSSSENDGQSSSEAINNSIELDEDSEKSKPVEGDLSNKLVRMKIISDENSISHNTTEDGRNPPYREVRMMTDNAIRRFHHRVRGGRNSPLYRGGSRIRDENASVSSRINQDRRNPGPNWGALRRRRARNAVFVSMDREIGIMNPSNRALRIRPQNSHDRDIGGARDNDHDHPRNLRMRIGLTEWPSRFRPQSDSGTRDESQENTD